MPVESSKAQIGRNLGLDFGAYIQGKSFTRSVSISESVPVASDCITTSDSGASTTYSSSGGRFASGGSGGSGGPGSQPSPSPLSSATATISPDSPLPSTSPTPFPPAQYLQSLSQPALSTPQQPMPAHAMQSPELVVSPTNLPESPSRSETVHTTTACVAEFSSLFQNADTHRTVSLLSHLIDSRLAPEWREALYSKTIPNRIAHETSVQADDQLSTTSEVLFSTAAVDVTDSLVTSRRPNPPTPSPSEDISVVKRFRHSDDCPESHLTKTQSEPRPDTQTDAVPSLSPTFVSHRLASCVCHLADYFESRYRDKLGSLLEDVSHLSVPNNVNDESGVDTTDTTVSDRSSNDELIHESQHALLITRARFHSVLRELFNDRINWGRVIAMLAFVRALCEHLEGTSDALRSAEGSHQTRTLSPDTTAETDVDSLLDTATTNTPTIGSAPPIPHPTNSARESDGASRSGVDEHSQDSWGSAAAVPVTDKVRAAHYVVWTAEFIHGPGGIWDWISANGGWDGLIRFEVDHGIADPAVPGDARVAVGFTEDEVFRLLRRAVTGVATLAVGAVGLVAALRFFSKRL